MALKPNYKPLRKLLVDRDLKPAALYQLMGLSRSTASTINNDRFVSMETIATICEFLNCRIEDVVEFIPENPNNTTYKPPGLNIKVDDLL